MKKYIGLILLLCLCLLGGCGKEERLAFLEEFTQEELDAYLIGRTREDLWEEFGESKFDFEQEDTKEYWEVDEFYGKNLRVEYDENFKVVSCEVYTYKSGVDFLPYYLLGFAIVLFGGVTLFGVGILLLFLIGRSRKVKANTFVIASIVAFLCHIVAELEHLFPNDSYLLIPYLISILLIPNWIMGSIFTIRECVKDGMSKSGMVRLVICGLLLLYFIYKVILMLKQSYIF